MLVEKMTRDECLLFLGQMKFGRVACVREKQPYVVPMYFIPDDHHLYGFSTLGRKIEWMRANPLVCVEVDEVIDHLHWKTAVIEGKYEELHDRPDRTAVREYALELLQRRAMWWQPVTASSQAGTVTPIFFRISIDRITGHRAAPDAIELGTLRSEIKSPSHPGIMGIRDRARRFISSWATVV